MMLGMMLGMMLAVPDDGDPVMPARPGAAFWLTVARVSPRYPALVLQQA